MEQAGKILAIFLLIFFFFIIFLYGIVSTISQKSHQRNYISEQVSHSFRGTISSSDGYTLAQSSRVWQVVFDGKHAEDGKKALIAKMLALHLDRSEVEILQLLQKDARVILAKELTTNEAKNIQHLSSQLDKMGAFRTFKQGSSAIRYGLEVTTMSPFVRYYPFDEIAEPVLGFVNKQSSEGQIGVERYYENQIADKKDGYIKAYRDAGGNLIYNNSLEFEPPKHGESIKLSINLSLQKSLESLLDKRAVEHEASEIITAIMESGSGKIVAIASTNRYNPNLITESTLANTRINAIQYPFEPGSVMKPFILALLFEEGIVGQYDLINGHNGRFKLGKETITDTIPKQWISAEDVIVFSSNIGIAQLALSLSPYKMFDGLSSFGFAKTSGVDLPYESVGELPSINRFKSDIYRATTAYGYGLRTSFMQLLKAYNVFNNAGILVAPRVIDSYERGDKEALDIEPNRRVVSEATAMKISQILRKTVLKGTAREANLDGLFIAGKTGTAHIARAGGYIDDYHSTFFGFANDKNSSYTIGVLFIDPKQGHLAGKTSAPLFRESAKLLVEHGFLTPDQ